MIIRTNSQDISKMNRVMRKKRVFNRKNEDKAKADYARKQIELFVRTFSRMCIKYGFIVPKIEYKHIASNDLNALKIYDHICHGQVYENQIETAFEIMYRLIHGENITCVGGMQCGKTGTSNICWFVGLLGLFEKHIQTRIVYLVPQFNSIKKQADREFHHFCEIYGNIEFQSNGYQLTLNDYLKGDKEETVAHFNQTSFVIGDKKSRVMRNNDAAIKKIIDNCKKNNIKLIFIIDECHWGAGVDTKMDKGFENARQEMFKLLNLATQAAEQDCQWVGFSATGWASQTVSKTVFHRLMPYYKGWNIWINKDGEGNLDYIDDRYDIKHPNIWSFDDATTESGVAISSIDRRMYKNPSTFAQKYSKEVRKKLKGKETAPWLMKFVEWCEEKHELTFDYNVDPEKYDPSTDPICNHYFYQSYCIEITCKFLKWLFKINPMKKEYDEVHEKYGEEYNLTHQTGLSMCLRFICANKQTKIVAEEFKKHLGNEIQVFTYLEDEIEEDIKTYLQIKINEEDPQDAYDPNKPMVLLVTGSCRMATNFPRHFCYFCDLVPVTGATSLSMSTALQAMPGRACGPFKSSLIIVDKKFKDILSDYSKHGRSSQIMDHRTKYEKPYTPGRPPSWVAIGTDTSQYPNWLKNILDIIDRPGGVMYRYNGRGKNRRLRRNQAIENTRRGARIPVETEKFLPGQHKEDEHRGNYIKEFWELMEEIRQFAMNRYDELWPGRFASQPILLPFDYHEAVKLYDQYDIAFNHDARKFYGGMPPGVKCFCGEFHGNGDYNHIKTKYGYRLGRRDGLDSGSSGKRGDNPTSISPQIYVGYERGNSQVSENNWRSENHWSKNGPFIMEPGDSLYARCIAFRLLQPTRELALLNPKIIPNKITSDLQDHPDLSESERNKRLRKRQSKVSIFAAPRFEHE